MERADHEEAAVAAAGSDVIAGKRIHRYVCMHAHLCDTALHCIERSYDNVSDHITALKTLQAIAPP